MRVMVIMKANEESEAGQMPNEELLMTTACHARARTPDQTDWARIPREGRDGARRRRRHRGTMVPGLGAPGWEPRVGGPGSEASRTFAASCYGWEDRKAPTSHAADPPGFHALQGVRAP